MKSAIALFFLLMGLWALSSGYFHDVMLLSFGVGSSIAVVVLCCRMGIVDSEGVPVHLFFRALVYAPWLALEIVKANLDVTRRVLHPRMPISPRVFEVIPTQKTDLGRVLYANSITLTPGTVSIEAEGGDITVHAIAREAEEGLLTGEMDRRVTRMEGAA